MEGQLSFSFEVSREIDVCAQVQTVQAQSTVNVVHAHVAQVTCISSRRSSLDKREESDAYMRVLQYARSLRHI